MACSLAKGSQGKAGSPSSRFAAPIVASQKLGIVLQQLLKDILIRIELLGHCHELVTLPQIHTGCSGFSGITGGGSCTFVSEPDEVEGQGLLRP